MHKDIAHRVCELIAGVLAVDGEIHPAESDFFGRILVALRQDIDPVDEIEPTLKGADAAKELGALPDDVRNEAFELLLAAAIVDGKVVPKEQRYLQTVAAAMGVSAEELEERLTDRLLES